MNEHAFNVLKQANAKQAHVTQDLRRREKSLAEAVKHVAAELRNAPDAARCRELAEVLDRLGRSTKRGSRLLQQVAAKVARI